VEETGTSQPLGEWVRQQWNRNDRWVWLPGVLDHACRIGVTELAYGSATAPDQSVVTQQVVSLHWKTCSDWLFPDSCAIDKQGETNML